MDNRVTRHFDKRIKENEKLTPTEAAYFLRVSKTTLQRYAANGNIKRHFGRGTGMSAFYLKSELEEFLRLY